MKTENRKIFRTLRRLGSLLILLLLVAGCEDVLGPGEIEKDSLKGSQKVDASDRGRVLL